MRQILSDNFNVHQFVTGFCLLPDSFILNGGKYFVYLFSFFLDGPHILLYELLYSAEICLEQFDNLGTAGQYFGLLPVYLLSYQLVLCHCLLF